MAVITFSKLDVDRWADRVDSRGESALFRESRGSWEDSNSAPSKVDNKYVFVCCSMTMCHCVCAGPLCAHTLLSLQDWLSSLGESRAFQSYHLVISCKHKDYLIVFFVLFFAKVSSPFRFLTCCHGFSRHSYQANLTLNHRSHTVPTQDLSLLYICPIDCKAAFHHMQSCSASLSANIVMT